MKLSSKTVTAIKLFVDLGEHFDNDEYISLVDVSYRKDVSKKFLEQIVPIYKNYGLLIGTRGNQGGYKLAKSPAEITLKEIIYISETTFQKEIYNYSPLDIVLNDIDTYLDDYLSKTTLSTLIEKQEELYMNSYII